MSLQAALAVPQVDDVAGAVPDDLHLDVPRAGEEFLDVQFRRAEGLFGFRACADERLFEVAGLDDGAHAASPAATDRLQHHRAIRTERLEEGTRLVQRDRLADSGEHWHTTLFGQRAGLRLVAETAKRLRGGADKDKTCALAAFGELRRFAQEPVAGMDGLATRLLRERNESLPIEVGGDTRRAEVEGLVPVARVQGLAVVFGEDTDRLDSEIRGRARDADGDFAAVGDQQTS